MRGNGGSNQAGRRARSAWLCDYELDNWHVVLLAVAGISLLAYGACALAGPLNLAMHSGLGAEVLVDAGGSRISGRGRYPVHLLFLWPALLVAADGFLLYSVFRWARES